MSILQGDKGKKQKITQFSQNSYFFVISVTK